MKIFKSSFEHCGKTNIVEDNSIGNMQIMLLIKFFIRATLTAKEIETIHRISLNE